MCSHTREHNSQNFALPHDYIPQDCECIPQPWGWENGNLSVFSIFLTGLRVYLVFSVLICKEWSGGRMCSEGTKPTAFSLSTSSFHICPAEDESFRQLRAMDPLSNLLWPKTFGQALQRPREFLLVVHTVAWTRPSGEEHLNIAHYGNICIYTVYMHNMVFQTNLHTSLHKYPVQLLWGTAAHIHKVNDTSQTHLTGQKPRNHSGSWGPLTVRQLSLQSKGNISCG